MKTACINFSSYSESIEVVLNQLNVADRIQNEAKIIIKPNLVNASPPPITTPVACCEAVVEYLFKYSKAEIIIAEGCGDMDMETDEIFDALGYTQLSRDYHVSLIDLNRASLKKLKDPQCSRFPEIYLPEIAFSHFIISLPVLKVHSLAGITGALKNMMGFAPPKHYAGTYGYWKKSDFHKDMHQSIRDLNKYRTPDLSLIDATIGLSEYHLGGAECSPPVNKIVASFDPVACDRQAAKLLGKDWKKIPHLV